MWTPMGVMVHTTFSVPSPAVSRAPRSRSFFFYVACRRFIREVLSAFTNLEVVFGWHLGGEVALGEREGGRGERKPASEMVIVSMHLAHSE